MEGGHVVLLAVVGPVLGVLVGGLLGWLFKMASRKNEKVFKVMFLVIVNLILLLFLFRGDSILRLLGF
jgi:small neutral amino acid transporter SnatA (MarC family)